MLRMISAHLLSSRHVISMMVALSFGGLACQETPRLEKKQSTQRYTDDSPVIASVGAIKITQTELERRLAELSPLSRARYQNPERRQELVETLIRFELLAGEALKQGHGDHPEVKLAYKQAMVRELLKNEVRDLVKIGDISEQEISAYYQEHLDKYQSPELVKASHILLATKAEAEAKLKELKLHISANPKQARQRFGDFASQHSTDAETRARRGDLQYFDQEGQLHGERRFPQSSPPKVIAQAAFTLTRVGDISEQVIQSEQGWHILMRTGGKRAFKRELKEVQTEIRNTLFRLRKAKALENYVKALKDKATIKINHEALKSLKLKSKANHPIRQQLNQQGLPSNIKVPLDLNQALSP